MDDQHRSPQSPPPRGKGPLRDAEVTATASDEKMYTGEPVETTEGTEVPRQMNVGARNDEGSGEFPSPSAPSRRADSGGASDGH